MWLQSIHIEKRWHSSLQINCIAPNFKKIFKVEVVDRNGSLMSQCNDNKIVNSFVYLMDVVPTHNLKNHLRYLDSIHYLFCS